MARVRISVDGKLALTVEQAAKRHRYSESTMRAILSRLHLEPVAKLDGRKPVYLATELDAAIRGRPGKGAPGRPRPRRSG